MKRLIIICCLAVLYACSPEQDVEKIKQELINADLEFAKLSLAKGKNYSFSNYIDENGVMLRPGDLPITSKKVLDSLQLLRPDTAYTLNWKPLFADAAKSGEMGYTYGIWLYTTKDTSTMGSYMTVWKKNKEGKWKFVMDTGTDGLGRHESELKKQF